MLFIFTQSFSNLCIQWIALAESRLLGPSGKIWLLWLGWSLHWAIILKIWFASLIIWVPGTLGTLESCSQSFWTCPLSWTSSRLIAVKRELCLLSTPQREAFGLGGFKAGAPALTHPVASSRVHVQDHRNRREGQEVMRREMIMHA